MRMEKIDTYISSSLGRKLIIGTGVALIALMVFHAGYVAGARHFSPRKHAKQWRFHGPGRFEMPMPPDFIRDGHGAIGRISEMTEGTLTIVAPDGSTSTVLRTGDTEVRNMRGTATSGALHVGTMIMVLGEPTEAGLEANLIRTLPPPPPRY